MEKFLLTLADRVVFDVGWFVSVNFYYLNESWAPSRKVLAVLVGLVVSPCVEKVNGKLLETFGEAIGAVDFYLSFVPDESSTELSEPAVLPAPSYA